MMFYMWLFLPFPLTFGWSSRHLGAFLVPYILMVFVIGLPMFLSELFVGQYSGLGPNQAYQYLAPFFHGK